MPADITCLIVDDHEVVREGLRLSLSRAPHIRVVGEAADGHDAVREAERLQPDVAVLDLMLPGINGLEVARRVVRRSPRTRIVPRVNDRSLRTYCMPTSLRSSASRSIVPPTVSFSIRSTYSCGVPRP